MSEASELLHSMALWIPDTYRAPHTKYGPGYLVARMTGERREIIKTLKSSDLENERPDSCWMYQEPKRKGRWGL
jgi:hypothetical protein